MYAIEWFSKKEAPRFFVATYFYLKYVYTLPKWNFVSFIISVLHHSVHGIS